MIWDKLVLLEWFIRGLVSVNCFFFCCLAVAFSFPSPLSIFILCFVWI